MRLCYHRMVIRDSRRLLSAGPKACIIQARAGRSIFSTVPQTFLLAKRQTNLFRHAAYVFCRKAIFLGALEVLYHQRRIRHLAEFL